MRMWMVNTAYMCNQHLLGEHVELHMIVGCINKNKNLRGYIEKGLVDLTNVSFRHRVLVEEMLSRGMRHGSPLADYSLDWQLKQNYGLGRIDIKKNEGELFARCDDCFNLFLKNNNIKRTIISS